MTIIEDWTLIDINHSNEISYTNENANVKKSNLDVKESNITISTPEDVLPITTTSTINNLNIIQPGSNNKIYSKEQLKNAAIYTSYHNKTYGKSIPKFHEKKKITS